MGPTDSFETPETKQQYTLRHIPEQRKKNIYNPEEARDHPHAIYIPVSFTFASIFWDSLWVLMEGRRLVQLPGRNRRLG